MNIFRKLKASLRLREAVKRAEQAHRNNGQRYYVMPVIGSKGKLIIMDRHAFRKMRKKHHIARNTNVHDLIRECFYHTPYANGTGAISPQMQAKKKQQYLKWVDWENRG